MMQERDIFIAILPMSAQRRAAHLADASAGDPELRRRVEQLLAEHEREQSFFLDAPFPGVAVVADRPVEEQPGSMIGPYKLLQQIGEGGFGVVFMAEQTAPVRRKVALKVIKPGMDTRQVIARFEAERQALAVMDHPNVSRVLEAGATASGRPYFVMELVRGVPITTYCDESNLPIRERLELFASVCQAIQHAHTKGIIHRDIKPTNVLVTRQDGQPVVKVIDFGIAKAMGQQLTDKTLFTEFAQMIGTPLYMSPEQAEMSSVDIDTRSDIYSLGVLLYELLTGSTPVDHEELKKAAFDEIRRVIREDEPQRPSLRISGSKSLPAIAAQRHIEPGRLSGLVRGELDWIVLKCLEKDRSRRYETASSLAMDVRRYLHDEPVLACPPSTLYRFGKLARRNKGALISVSAVAVAVMLVVAALAESTVLVWRANSNLTESLARERITLAHRDLSVDNLAGAMKLLEECPDELREWEWHYLMRLCRVEPLVLRDNTEVNGVAFSPDGERLVSAGGDGSVKIWNSRTGEVVKTFLNVHADSVVAVAFHPDGKHFASKGADQQVKVWDWTTDRELFVTPSDAIRRFGTAYTVAFSPDGRQLVAGSDGAVQIWDWKQHQLLHTLPGHEKNAISVAFSRDGRRLASACAGEGVKLWDAGAGGELPLRTILAHRHPISALGFSPDGGRLASASFDRSVKVWDTMTGRLLHTLEKHTGNVDCVAFSPNGGRLVSGGEDKTVRVWDASTGREMLGLRGHTGRCGCVAFSPDGWRIASASTDRTIRVWDATPLQGGEGQEAFTFAEHNDEIRSVAFSPDGRKIASAGRGSLVKIWDPATGKTSIEFDGHTNVVFCLAWDPVGERIASAGWDGRLHTVWVWDARTGKPIFQLPPEGEYFALAFSPGGRHLLAGKGDGGVQVWDARTGQSVGTLGMHGREVRGVVFSRDGRHFASASSDGWVKLWDATRLDQAQEPRLIIPARIPGPSVNVAFSPDGQRLATGGDENTVKIWDVETGRELQTLRGHSGEVYALEFSPDADGRWIASAGEDSAVKLWDSHAGTLARNFRGHTGVVSSVAFSSDGRRLVSGSRDKSVKVWDVTPYRSTLETLP